MQDKMTFAPSPQMSGPEVEFICIVVTSRNKFTFLSLSHFQISIHPSKYKQDYQFIPTLDSEKTLMNPPFRLHWLG